jgi:hypothetical protein
LLPSSGWDSGHMPQDRNINAGRHESHNCHAAVSDGNIKAGASQHKAEATGCCSVSRSAGRVPLAGLDCRLDGA